MIFLYVLLAALGLAVFLIGMKIMCRGLGCFSQGRLKQILSKTAKSKVRGVLLGAAVTAVVQSSSAVTVLLVGLAQAGILTLKETVGVIMGANIGTTVTSWIIAITSADVSLPVPVIIIISIVCFAVYFTLTILKKADKAGIFLGLALFLSGMYLMTNGLYPFRDIFIHSEFISLCSNPFLGLLFGTATTAVLQSSSAAVGVMQALSVTGVIPFSAAIPLVAGQNIGTCVTALISSAGCDKNARATAFIHLYFNLIGSLFLLAAFYGADVIFDFPFLQNAVNMLDITVIHTLFNLLSTVILLPFSGVLVFLAKKTVR